MMIIRTIITEKEAVMLFLTEIVTGNSKPDVGLIIGNGLPEFHMKVKIYVIYKQDG